MNFRGKGLMLTVLTLVLGGGVPTFAASDVGVGLVYGVTSASQNGGGSSSNARSGTAYGALVELSAPASRSGLLAGVLYSELGGHQTNTFWDFDVKLPYYQIPVLAEFWLAPIIAIGGGGYYGFPAANSTRSGTILGVSGSTSDTFANQGWKGDDFGLAINARAHISLGLVYLSGDVIYEYGLENVSTVSGQTVNNRALLAMIGVGIGI